MAYSHQHGVRCIRLVETMIQSFKPEEIVILSSSFWIPFRLWLQREKSRRYFFYQASSKVSQSIGSFLMTKYFGCYILLQEVKELLMLAVFKGIILYLYPILTYFYCNSINMLNYNKIKRTQMTICEVIYAHRLSELLFFFKYLLKNYVMFG